MPGAATMTLSDISMTDHAGNAVAFASPLSIAPLQVGTGSILH